MEFYLSIALFFTQSLILLALVFGLVFSILSHQRDKKRLKRLLNSEDARPFQALDSIHRILRLRTGLSYSILERYNNNKLGDKLENNRILSEFISNTVEDIKYFFEKSTEEICSVSIKIITSRESGRVSTLARDITSNSNRKKDSDLDYDIFIKDNTDFYQIYNRKFKYFFSNNLLNEDGYVNQSKEYYKYYNATCVYPLYYGDPLGPINNPDIIGFVCVDSLKAEFDEALTASYLRVVSVVLGYAIGLASNMNDYVEIADDN